MQMFINNVYFVFFQFLLTNVSITMVAVPRSVQTQLTLLLVVAILDTLLPVMAKLAMVQNQFLCPVNNNNL